MRFAASYISFALLSIYAANWSRQREVNSWKELRSRYRTSIKIRYNNSIAIAVPLCALNTFESRKEPEDVVVTGEAGR